MRHGPGNIVHPASVTRPTSIRLSHQSRDHIATTSRPHRTLQLTIHDTLSTHVHSFIPSFFTLLTLQTREIQINNTLHICSHYFLRNDSCYEAWLTIDSHQSRDQPRFAYRIRHATIRNHIHCILIQCQMLFYTNYRKLILILFGIFSH